VEMERRINNTLRQLNITRVAVAHRPETIAAADRVFSLAKALPGTNIVRAPMAAAAALGVHPVTSVPSADVADNPIFSTRKAQHQFSWGACA